MAPSDELCLARSVADGDCGGDPRLWIQPDAARRRVYRRMDPRRHRSRHVADARARLGPDHTHLYRRACAYHQDLPPRAGPRRTVAPLYRCCRLAGHRRAQHARRCPPCAPHHGAAQRSGPARGRTRPHAALRRQDGNAGAGHRARKRRLAERHHRRRRPGKHRGRAQPPAAPDARGKAAADALCQRMRVTSCARPSR